MLSTQKLDEYELLDCYRRRSGRVFLTGTQALVRIVLDQARRDSAQGLNTAGFVSGYRGSPLGGVDREMWRAKALLDEHRVEFLPAVNEDLAATALLGSQQVETQARRTVDGVFGLWYGKGPGIDRSGDALKHGNAYGASPRGGVLVVAGDDHGCVSSSMPHQSDVAFMSWFMPTLHPASVAEYLSFGAYGYALSRFSGMWVGFKAVSETVESATSVVLPPEWLYATPAFKAPPGGLHYRWPDLPGPQIEERMEAKKAAVEAFARANPLDRVIHGVPDATYGIVTTGKAHLDLMEALELLGLDAPACRRIGLAIYKVGMVWPLARHDALSFVTGKREILVVEEKRGIIESQFKEYFYDYPGRKPERMVGKHDEKGNPLVPWIGELSPRLLAPIVAARLDTLFPGLDLARRARALVESQPGPIDIGGTTRTPYFCSGCPHNTSTRVPEGSRALAGIGCHGMASWMDRETGAFTHMGGEGVNWAAVSRFTNGQHIFQNLGDGTYYHSGSLAIRQSIAAGTNITYKILFNSAVAMTGGQPVDGPVSVETIAHSLRAEGVERIAVVSDAPARFVPTALPAGVTLHDRRDLDTVQRELRDVKGVSVLIYDQMCATEKRRRRKRELMPKAGTSVVINELVCEGCGDCSIQSNCLSVEPVETPFGRKRRINQSTCNTDLSCLEGFCPSFVTVEGTRRRKDKSPAAEPISLAAALLAPSLPSLDKPFNLLVTGVGGTGVVTVGQLVTMAAHLQGLGASVLDFTGFAQKFGPVLSFIRIGAEPRALNQVRIDRNAADALIACDAVVSSSPRASRHYRRGMRALLNTAAMPTGDIVRNRDAELAIDSRVAAIAATLGAENVTEFDANRAAEKLHGDTVFSNVMMLGMAWQMGLVPLAHDSIMRAIELNGVAIDENKKAFAWGRLAAASPHTLAEHLAPEKPPAETLDALVGRHVEFLTKYQDEAYAGRYRDAVAQVQAVEAPLASTRVTEAVARSLFKLMAYKDEYEVARLHLSKEFRDKLAAEYEPGFKVRYHLAPPALPTGRDSRGRPRKAQFGAWMEIVFHALARWKNARGTWLDAFRRTHDRQLERALIGWYEGVIGEILGRLASGPLDAVAVDRLVQLAAAPLDIRGYGPVKAKAADEVRARVARLLEGTEPAGRFPDATSTRSAAAVNA